MNQVKLSSARLPDFRFGSQKRDPSRRTRVARRVSNRAQTPFSGLRVNSPSTNRLPILVQYGQPAICGQHDLAAAIAAMLVIGCVGGPYRRAVVIDHQVAVRLEADPVAVAVCVTGPYRARRAIQDQVAVALPFQGVGTALQQFDVLQAVFKRVIPEGLGPGGPPDSLVVLIGDAQHTFCVQGERSSALTAVVTIARVAAPYR